jgi:hypothetical protein
MNWVIENFEAVLAAMMPLAVIGVLVTALVKSGLHRVFDTEIKE